MSLPSDEHGDDEESILGRLAISLLIYLSEGKPVEKKGLAFPRVWLERDGLWAISLALLFITGQEERERGLCTCSKSHS